MREGLQKIAPTDDTIVAISTPMGRSGIGVVRLSGPQSEEMVRRFLKASMTLEHRRAVVGQWVDHSDVIVDDVIVTFFRRPHSYTGEDLIEVSSHGNPLILRKILEMARSAGARLAGPGEFTLRAVAHGKMDLIQAEAVRDFIEAQTDAQARMALQQMSGALSRKIVPIKDDLIGTIARLEAGIDFAEDDVDIPDSGFVVRETVRVRAALEALQETYAYGKLLSEGIRVVIAGKPNVGKSSLFNRLLSADRAIVTDVPGTTRDVLAETSHLEGIPIRFFDTAGVRETSDVVESIGVSRTMETLSEADLVLLVVDGSISLEDEDREIWKRVREIPHVVVANKCDLGLAHHAELGGSVIIPLSAKTGEGMDSLREAIRGFLEGSRAEGVAESVLTNARQNDAVLQSIEALLRVERALSMDVPHEMVLLDFYAALSALNELTGEITTEDILGRIFSTFCIGK